MMTLPPIDVDVAAALAAEVGDAWRKIVPELTDAQAVEIASQEGCACDDGHAPWDFYGPPDGPTAPHGACLRPARRVLALHGAPGARVHVCGSWSMGASWWTGPPCGAGTWT